MTRGTLLLKSLSQARRDVNLRKRNELEELERDIVQMQERFHALYPDNEKIKAIIDKRFKEINKKIYDKLKYLGP